MRDPSSGGIPLVMGLMIGLLSALSANYALAEDSEVDKIDLFNGRDLRGFSTWLKDSKTEDPRGVFRVENGLIRISGDGFGYLATKNEYRDYRLVVEYRWGRRTDGGNSVRNAGILLHAVGPDGNAGKQWMASIECQLAQGCVGDLIVIRGEDDQGAIIPTKLIGESEIGRDKHPRWKPGGKPRLFEKGQLWWSRHDPDFKERIDTRGKDDVESLLGKWTTVECVCEGDRIEILVNGTKVNEAQEVYPASGKILLQSEGFEWFIRRLELTPLRKRADER